MSLRSTLSRLGSRSVATSALLLAVATPAMAATDAVVRLVNLLHFGPGTLVLPTYYGNSTSGPFTTYTGITAYAQFAYGVGTVQVGTGPTPSVVFPSNVVSYMLTNYPFSYPPYTPTGYFTLLSRRNLAATLQKSHPSAVNGTTTINVVNATTICHQDYTMTPNGSPAPDLAGQCFPRTGILSAAEGPLRYGGTLRLVGKIIISGKRAGSPFDNYFYLTAEKTAMGTGPAPPSGNYYESAVGTRITTNAGYRVDSQAQNTEGPYTTGMVRAYKPGGGYFTSINKTGSFNLNGTNLTGTISLVKPAMQTTFNRAGGVIVSTGPDFGIVYTTALTFLPEPRYLAMLGFGLLALVGIQTARQR